MKPRPNRSKIALPSARKTLGGRPPGQLVGVYVRGTGGGPGPSPAPQLDDNGYALLGQTSWWPQQGIETCFPQGESLTCRDPFSTAPVNGGVGAGPVIDPQIGWEQQKFMTLFTLMYLPSNQRLNWIDQMRTWALGNDSDPGFENRIEFHDPTGRTYVAETFGTEVLYGKTVQKGIAARMLQYANELLVKSVKTTPIVRGGVTVGYQPTLDVQGNPQYLQGGVSVAACENSRDCTKLKNYVTNIQFLREMMGWFGYVPLTGLKGVY